MLFLRPPLGGSLGRRGSLLDPFWRSLGTRLGVFGCILGGFGCLLEAPLPPCPERNLAVGNLDNVCLITKTNKRLGSRYCEYLPQWRLVGQRGSRLFVFDASATQRVHK